MSFVWKAPQRLKTPGQVARELLEVAQGCGLGEFAAVLATMCVAQESDFWCPANEKDPTSKNYPHDSLSDDGRSVGYFQQQNGVPGENPAGGDNWWGPMSSRMDLKQSATKFYERLEENYLDAINDKWMASRRFIQNVQRSAYPDAYAKHWDRAWQLVRATPKETTVTDPNRPAFNEFPIWSDNNSARGGTKVDAFFIHTQEGGGGNSAAEDLAKWFQNANGVSYHYTISQASDGGVTVVDCVDTDLMSWSVLSANARSINLCFAGSRAGWSREQWMKQANAIDVAAYLAVQDCKKYGIATKVIAPPYTERLPGISDHRYVTKILGDGTHTDVGDQFPWDVFKAAVDKYAVATPQNPVPPTPPKVKVFPKDYTDRELLEYIAEQLGPGHPSWESKGMTLRDKVWNLK